MSLSNCTPFLYIRSALVQCIAARSVRTYGLVALLLVCSSVIAPASAQEPAHGVKVMARTELKWMFIQITKFNNDSVDMFVNQALLSFESCHSLKDNKTAEWKYNGDHAFVKSVAYLCIPKRRVP